MVFGSTEMRSNNKEETMPKYVIERDMPGAGKLTAAELRGASAKSNVVLAELGPGIEWLESYVTGDKIYCVYIAASEDTIREHARRSGFPATRIARVAAVIDPVTAE
jgi:hypothetical protein